MSAVATPPASPPSSVGSPSPTGEICPLCGAPLDSAQEWCLSCGGAARTRLAATPRWRTPLVLLGLTIALALGTLTAALVSLAGGSGGSAASTTSVTHVIVAAPGAIAPSTPATSAAAPAATAPASGTAGTTAPGATAPGATPGATATAPAATHATTSGAATTTTPAPAGTTTGTGATRGTTAAGAPAAVPGLGRSQRAKEALEKLLHAHSSG
jgi:hypothetical protein